MDPQVTPQRLFFALWPAAALQRQLVALAEHALPRHGSGRRPPTVNLHLTLAFLGSVDTAVRVCLEQAVNEIRVPAFDLALDKLGFIRRRGLLWASPSRAPAPLAALVSGLQAAQLACGLSSDQRPFHAHVTLARNLRRRPPQTAIEPIVWPVREFMLVRSDLSGGGARYEVLRTWALT